MKNDKKISTLGLDVLKLIKSKKIKPEPKWIFALKNYFVWFVSALSIVIGSLAFSVIIYMLKNSDWDIYENINGSLFKFVLVTLPYFWIAFLVFFVFIADYNLKHTKSGYKYQVYFFTAVSVGISIFLGLFMHNFGVGRIIDDAFAERIPIYKSTINKMHKRGMMWNRPSEGFLSGVIISVDDEKNIRIRDMHNFVWNIYREDTYAEKEIRLALNTGVRLFGKEIANDEKVNSEEKSFLAEKILPLPNMPWMKRNFLLEDIERERAELEKRDLEKIGIVCELDSDCETPFAYLIRSNCPYKSRCIEDKCKVICQVPYDNLQNDLEKIVQCSTDTDCDCENSYKSDYLECLCIDDSCLVVVAE